MPCFCTTEDYLSAIEASQKERIICNNCRGRSEESLKKTKSPGNENETLYDWYIDHLVSDFSSNIHTVMYCQDVIAFKDAQIAWNELKRFNVRVICNSEKRLMETYKGDK